MTAAAVSRQVFSGNTLRESVTFRDEDGDDFTPTTLEVRVVNREDNSQIQDWTTISSPAPDMNIIFDGSYFETQDPTKPSEKHEVVLFANRQESGPRASFVYSVEVIRAG